MFGRLGRLFQRAEVAPVKGPTYPSVSRGSYVPNWFQRDLWPRTRDPMASSVTYACISIIAQEIARMPVHVWTREPESGHQRKRSDPELDALLRRPNHYQTHTDFWLYVVWALLTNGNGYWFRETLAGRDQAWHPLPPGSVTPYVNETTGDIFYRVADSNVHPLDIEQLVPARNVAHLRLFCTTHPLIGETPLRAASLTMAQNESIKANSANFFTNMARPSGILTAPDTVTLTEDTANSIKERFYMAAAEQAVGRPVVLGHGYEWQNLTMTAVDAAIVEQYRMTVQDIARVFRMPLHMIGDLEGATLNNIRELQRSFITHTLGFYIEHIETQMDAFLDFGPDKYTEFDVEGSMLRPDFQERMDAYSKAVQGGIYAPNEARETEHLPAVEGGDQVYLQAQMEPLTTRMDPPEPQPTDAPPPELALAAALRQTRLERRNA